MLKKLICTTSALALALALTACGSSESTPASSTPASSTPAVSSEAVSSAPASSEAAKGGALDQSAYLEEAMGLAVAAQNFADAFQGIAVPSTTSDEEIAALTEDMLARIKTGREALQPFYDFAQVLPPEGQEAVHAEISEAAAKLADSANKYMDTLEGIMKEEIDPSAYDEAEATYTTESTEAANALVSALSKLDPVQQ